MYIAITPQKSGSNYTRSVADFVAYLEKENKGKSIEDRESFFNQHNDQIPVKEVIHGIDANTSNLKKTAPKFYAITLNPSQHELKQLKNTSEGLKAFTREVMNVYVTSFNRDIEGRPIRVEDIKYYAKIEHERSYKGRDEAIRENAPYHKKIRVLKQEIKQIKRGTFGGDIQKLEEQIKQLEMEAPHKVNGKMITQGMPKEGAQSHIHIIVSRKDQSNRYSLSPGSKYKASEVMLNGKIVKRGFNRDAFFKNAEKSFDTLFSYQRNYVESYQARKTFVKQPQHYYSRIMGLPTSEKAVALKMLGKSGQNTPLMNLPIHKVQLVLKAINQIKRGLGKAAESESIGL